jgi:hypothetical protein
MVRRPTPKTTRKATIARAARGKSARAGAKPAGSGFRAKIRMYRQGLGDSFLITLPRTDKGRDGRDNFYILIDCGVILGTPDAVARMTKVVQNITADTKGEIDLLVVTHEHWDHVSGFVQAKDLFDKLKVHEVWMAWTEDPKDDLANRLRAERETALAALRFALSEYQLAGDSQSTEDLGGILEFFGAAKGGTTKDALNNALALAPNARRFCLPKGRDNPIDIAPAGVKVYILGPPHDEKQLRKINPSKADQETYGLALGELSNFLDGVRSAFGLSEDNPAPSFQGGDDPDRPFQPLNDIPFSVAREMDFFKQHYWRTDSKDDEWRRIDGAWLQGSAELALQLDSITNNTSLALAIELDGGDVLLFAADAQVGNWLSWQDLTWSVDGKTVTAADLLHRALFYKVGHHASHNATLREKGLELMQSLQVAMIPVDEKMAQKKHWNHMPLPELVDRLTEKANAVIRVDRPLPTAGAGFRLRASSEQFEDNSELYYELSL